MIYYVIMAAGVLIAGFSQMLLKKSSQKEYKKGIFQYLNILVITAYGLFFLSTLCTAIAMREVPLSMAPVWNSSGIIVVAILSMIFFKEVPNIKKWIGILIIIIGIVIFSIE